MAESPHLLSNRQILKLAEGLSSLDGVVEGGKVVRFKLDNDTAWHVALDLEAVARAKVAYERRLKSLGAELGVVERMELTPANAANVAKYMDEQETLLEQTQDMSCLHSYCRKALQEKNAIPPSVLANLLPLLEDE